MTQHHHLGCACCSMPHLPSLFDNLPDPQQALQALEAALKQAIPSHTPARAVFCGGPIYTVAANGNQRVEALGIADGVIVATGSLQLVETAMEAQMPGQAYDRIDLAGRTLLPGLIDPHAHVLPSALYRHWLPLAPFKGQRLDPQYSYESISAQIREALSQSKLPKDAQGDPWVLGFGVDPSLMKEWIDINADLLNELSEQTPIALINASGHIAYANTPALRKAGLLNPDGSLPPSKGVLTEDRVKALLGAMPPIVWAEAVLQIPKVLQDASQTGITTLLDAGAGVSGSKLEIDLLKLAAHGGPLRIAAALFTPDKERMQHWKELQITPDLDNAKDKRFALKAIKLIYDGSNQGLTGYQNEPYPCAEAHPVPDVPPTGLHNLEPGELAELIQLASDEEWPILIHANGDHAMADVLNGYAESLAPASEAADKKRRLRMRVEHASLMDDRAIAKMARLKVSPSFLIGHVGYWGYAFNKTILGNRRAQLLDRAQSAVQAGMRVSLHSDHFVSPFGPLRMMEQAIFRTMEGAPAKERAPLNPAECLSREQALRAVTLDAAWQCHMDHLVGSLEPGKLADLVILDQNPLDDAVTDLRGITVCQTWLNGAPVYRNPSHG
ncbi:amidohydrolase [Chromobacterium subtsugae]|uniref:amidohydrolase n=1 Tax=Chromobacterium subtsugae TaxID=251747 RepID=UPI00064108D1|nr:amidohydrolase [Chromobacterium subtsugae]